MEIYLLEAQCMESRMTLMKIPLTVNPCGNKYFSLKYIVINYIVDVYECSRVISAGATPPRVFPYMCVAGTCL
jgi:hypothetical protein